MTNVFYAIYMSFLDSLENKFNTWLYLWWKIFSEIWMNLWRIGLGMTIFIRFEPFFSKITEKMFPINNCFDVFKHNLLAENVHKLKIIVSFLDSILQKKMIMLMIKWWCWYSENVSAFFKFFKLVFISKVSKYYKKNIVKIMNIVFNFFSSYFIK